MRHYETLFIVTPELSEEEVAPVTEKFSGILTDHGAVMVKIDNWGRRRLAYEVKKFNKGYFVLFEYGSEPEGVAEMERNFKIDDQVIRFLTVKKNDEFDPDEVMVEPEETEEPAEETAAEAVEEEAEEAKPAEEPAEEAAPAADEAEEAPAQPADEEAAPAEEPAPADDEPKE